MALAGILQRCDGSSGCAAWLARYDCAPAELADRRPPREPACVDFLRREEVRLAAHAVAFPVLTAFLGCLLLASAVVAWRGGGGGEADVTEGSLFLRREECPGAYHRAATSASTRRARITVDLRRPAQTSLTRPQRGVVVVRRR